MGATTGGGKWRFNPNLYESGKVCLSLLGTWQGEPWDPKTSNLSQVFMSIYALIFVDEPYFNEPGYQSSRGTKSGDACNLSYNMQQHFKTLEIAMIGQLKKKDQCYDEVIRSHFKIKSSRILESLTKWSKEFEEWNKLNQKGNTGARVTVPREWSSGKSSNVSQAKNMIGELKNIIKKLK